MTYVLQHLREGAWGRRGLKARLRKMPAFRERVHDFEPTGHRAGGSAVLPGVFSTNGRRRLHPGTSGCDVLFGGACDGGHTWGELDGGRRQGGDRKVPMHKKQRWSFQEDVEMGRILLLRTPSDDRTEGEPHSTAPSGTLWS